MDQVRKPLINYNNISKLKCELFKHSAYTIEHNTIIPKTDKITKLNPFEYFSATPTTKRIYIELSNIDTDDFSSILAFCNQYGLLFKNQNKLHLDKFIKEVKRIKAILELIIVFSQIEEPKNHSVWSQTNKNLRNAILSVNAVDIGGPLALLKRDTLVFCNKDYINERLDNDEIYTDLKKHISTSKLMHLSKEIFCEFINKYTSTVHFNLAVENDDIIQMLSESDLITAMYVQLYLDVTNNRKIYKCKCGTIFLTAPKTKNKKHCSYKCAHRFAEREYEKRRKNIVTSSSKKTPMIT